MQSVFFFDDLAVCSCDTASFSTEWLCWDERPVKKCHFHGRCIALTTNECHSFAVKHAWDTSGTAVYRHRNRLCCLCSCPCKVGVPSMFLGRLAAPTLYARTVPCRGFGPNLWSSSGATLLCPACQFCCALSGYQATAFFSFCSRLCGISLRDAYFAVSGAISACAFGRIFTSGR